MTLIIDSKRKQQLLNAAKKWREGHRVELREIGKKQNSQKKHRSLSIVGHGKIECANCGCNDERILEINHVNGGGRKEMLRNGGAGTIMWNEILYNGRKTDDLDIRCKPCNALHAVGLKYPELVERFVVVWE